jgi:hypothetical protein
MADKDLRRRTTQVFPGTRPPTDDAISRSAYDRENRSFSAGSTDPLAELERLVGEIDSVVKARADAGRGSKVNSMQVAGTPRSPAQPHPGTGMIPPHRPTRRRWSSNATSHRTGTHV